MAAHPSVSGSDPVVVVTSARVRVLRVACPTAWCGAKLMCIEKMHHLGDLVSFSQRRPVVRLPCEKGTPSNIDPLAKGYSTGAQSQFLFTWNTGRESMRKGGCSWRGEGGEWLSIAASRPPFASPPLCQCALSLTRTSASISLKEYQ